MICIVPVGDVQKDADGNQVLRMRLLTDTTAYMDFVYTILANDYMVGMSIESYQMDKVMPSGMNYLEMQWQAKIKQQERGRKFEERYSMVQYKFVADDVENLNASKNDRKMLGGNVKWIAFKDQFFSSVLIADNYFTSTVVESHVEDRNSGYLKNCFAEMAVAYDPTGKEKQRSREGKPFAVE